MSKKIPIDTIPFDASIKIDMPGSFYARIQQFVLYFSNTHPPEEVVKAMNQLKERKEPETDFQYHLHTLTILINDIEQSAKKQGVMVVKEFELDDDGTIKAVKESNES